MFSLTAVFSFIPYHLTTVAGLFNKTLSLVIVTLILTAHYHFLMYSHAIRAIADGGKATTAPATAITHMTRRNILTPLTVLYPSATARLLYQ